MATIIVENVPDSIAKDFWTKLFFSDFESFKPKKRFINRLEWLSKEQIETKFYNKEKEVYWHFLNFDEAITFLDRK